MKIKYDAKVVIEGSLQAIEGFSSDEKFLILADGTQYRIELLPVGFLCETGGLEHGVGVDLSSARLLEVARLNYLVDQGWNLNGQSLRGWIDAHQPQIAELNAKYNRGPQPSTEVLSFVRDWHRRSVLYSVLVLMPLRVQDEEQPSFDKQSVSGVAWFREDPPPAADGNLGRCYVGGRISEVCCLLRTFHRQDAPGSFSLPPYSVEQTGSENRWFLRFMWNSGPPVMISVPRDSLHVWRRLFGNPGQWFTIPELMGRQTTGYEADVISRSAPSFSVKGVRRSKQAIEKRLRGIAEEKEEFPELSSRGDNLKWQQLEDEEEKLARALKQVTRKADLDFEIPGANTWGVWKKRLLDAVGKKHPQLADHLRKSIETQTGSVRNVSSLLRWRD